MNHLVGITLINTAISPIKTTIKPSIFSLANVKFVSFILT
ncbi:hypothetical protein SHDE107825_00150 [Shewanella denitrificans]